MYLCSNSISEAICYHINTCKCTPQKFVYMEIFDENVTPFTVKTHTQQTNKK